MPRPPTRHLPDLDALTEETLARACAIYICSPANPQGAAADDAYWVKLIQLARGARHHHRGR
ncbi:aminotransferase class I/II-fold pyridoxal phosphate-dependent enzyme [Pyruvatibacter mobilis]|uniref:aminotransferase class I/II-fold pyridoxal phosphate-dependent enzyme n=1 Tax=Pyruvatibacter mobilis TaxID=1712261 RepID=UPI003BAAA97C